MRALLLAMALSSIATIAAAQDADMAQMRQAHTMLQTNVERLLSKYDIEADIESLTLGQLAAITGIAEQSGSMSEQDLRGQLAAIARR